MTPAQKLTKHVRVMLDYCGWLSFKCAAGMIRTDKRVVAFGTVGAPDLVAIKGDRYLLLEIKAGKDRLSPSQKLFAQNVADVGGQYHVIRSVDDLMNLLNA